MWVFFPPLGLRQAAPQATAKRGRQKPPFFSKSSGEPRRNCKYLAGTPNPNIRKMRIYLSKKEKAFSFCLLGLLSVFFASNGTCSKFGCASNGARVLLKNVRCRLWQFLEGALLSRYVSGLHLIKVRWRLCLFFLEGNGYRSLFRNL